MAMFTPDNTKGFTPARLAQMNADYDRLVAQLETHDNHDYGDECSLVADRVWRAYEIARFVR